MIEQSRGDNPYKIVTRCRLFGAKFQICDIVTSLKGGNAYGETGARKSIVAPEVQRLSQKLKLGARF